MSLPVRLLLTRHARTAWNQQGRFQGHSDVPLDELGRAQSAALAVTLAGRVEAVIASDLCRARETAEIVAAALGIPLLGVNADLRERGYGIFEGLSREECIAQHPEIWAGRRGNPNFEVPGGEPHARVVERMYRGLEHSVALLGQYSRGLLIGHGSSLRMLLEAISGGPVGQLANLESREVLYDGRRFSYQHLQQ